MTTPERASAAQERLRWSLELAGGSRGLDLVPAAIGRSVAVEIDGRRVGRVPKPTPQEPWREVAFEIDGRTVVICLSWAFPVMRTDVFLAGRSARDGRAIEIVRAESPAALSNYEVWLGGALGTPSPVPQRGPRRALLASVAVSAAAWFMALAVSPFPAALRFPVAGVLLVSFAVLLLAFLRSWLAVGERVHRALLARPSMGDARVVLWFLAFVGYALLAIGVAGALLAVAAM